MNALRILIVDDQPINLRLLRAELEAEGHLVIDASNGAEALEVLNRERIEVVISDILMPVMDGYRLCSEIRRNDRFRHLPFIAYTATYLSPSDEKLTLSLGADKYIRKPASLGELMTAIRDALDSPRRRPTARIDEADKLKEYSSRLVIKLEEKNVELGQANERLQLQSTALETAADAIIITDADGRMLWVNPAFVQMTGYDRDEVIGETPRILKSGRHDPAFYRSFWQTIQSGLTWRGEFTNRRKDGTLYQDEHTVTPVRGSDGGITHFIGIMHEVTQRKAAEGALRESERRFREMLDNLQLVSVMLDESGRVTYCNDYLLRLTGFRRDEVLGKDWFALFVPAEHIASIREVFFRALEERGDAAHHANEILTRTGARRLIQWTNATLRSASGQVIGTASIGDDVTDRKRLEEQILRAQRMESLGTLASGMAHDLNNLFMPIVTGTERLQRHFALDGAALRIIDNIQQSVKRGTDLVQQVLLFARGGDVSRVELDLRKIIAEVETIVKSTFPRNITLSVRAMPAVTTVLGDATQLHQVLLNLCVNARDAMPRGGHLTISASNVAVAEREARGHGGEAEEYLVIEVADTGSGIPREIADRIFEPFFTTKEIGKGTGLGLSTVQGIVRSHGGFIEVVTEIGSGSTFRVHLPATIQPRAQETETVDEWPNGNGELVLIVDDEAAILAITSESLQFFGYSVVAAENGARALTELANRQPRIAAVVTDLTMPVMDGAALIAGIRKLAPAIPIIATSGGGSQGDEMRLAIDAGATYFLSKPYTTDKLLQLLAKALRGSGPTESPR